MIWIFLSATALLTAALPALLFVQNLSLYRPPRGETESTRPAISVLIPARNEEKSIENAVTSVLRSTDVELEVIAMNDSSTDRTAEIVLQLAAKDSRVRLETAPALPAGWNGKQHACWVLAHCARYNIFCFMDADVTLQPDALTRMAAFLKRSGTAMVSGFPRQETITFLEWLLLPLIHFVLLGFLPVSRMRSSPSPSLAAGCGQFLMVEREAYEASGGHAAIRATMHDGLLLPRLLRSHGYATDLADITHLATCRMYRNAGEVWRGLAKNATEGLATPGRIVPVTLLLFAGQVLPLLLVLHASIYGATLPVWAFSTAALFFAYLPRLVSVWRFQQPLKSALLHPAGMSVLLVLQWYAFLRKIFGLQATWKQREYSVG